MTSAQQTPLLKSTPHLNNGLFADYYLNEIVPTLPEWSDGQQFAEARAVLQRLRDLRQQINPAALDEAQLEEQWVKPVLDALGHHFSVQVKIRYRDRGHRKPDYVLVRSDDEARALTSEIYAPDQIAHALAVADAKRWGVKLDQSAPNQRNPAQQIDEYLRYSELSWGILTDGRYWRLYHRDTSKYNTYYAVDLDQLLTGDDPDAFLYFYVFFRQAAFTSGWLAKVLAGSEDFAQKLTDKLEDEVYEALELIAQGFLDYRRNRLTPDPATLHLIYEQSLVLLYRLLFIFYAESREILPLNQNDEYTQQRGLTAIKRIVTQMVDFNKTLNRDSGEIYQRLGDLFFFIDSGHDQLDLPPYNGRLFSVTDHPFLVDKAVGDAYLVPALDKLARVDVVENRRAKRVFVDYRDLEVRHLGSIYEKLLEYELDIATQPLALKNGQYIPAADPATAIKQAGQVYLRTGSNERKITGSYYTPDYIVRFIVEKTIEPLLTAITERHAHQDDDGQWHVRDAEALVAEVLALNVLDPATGSGHFVVDATSYIAEWLTSLALRPADLGDEDELIYWKRQVASACIYAVDINPLAVELAKLSMWLTTLAQGKPLSFLDHHIRVGNSLVGASIFDISDDLEEEKRRKKRQKAAERAAAAGQMALFSDDDFAAGVRFAVAQMAEIEGTVADDVRAVKHQEQLYADLTQRLSRWQQAANLWTARYFGLDMTDGLGVNITGADWKQIREQATDDLPMYLRRVLNAAGRIAAEYRFFHWELAFPEVFFNADGTPKENPGFDAVIGNPPYVRQESISPIKGFLQPHFADVYSGAADIYVYFYAQGLEKLRQGGLLSFITPNKWFSAGYGEGLRGYLAENSSVRQIVDFGHAPIFKGVDTFPMIGVFGSVGEKSETVETEICDFPREELVAMLRQADVTGGVDLNRYTRSHSIRVPAQRFSSQAWSLEPPEVDLLMEKIQRTGTPLQEFTGTAPYYGIKTGFNQAFLIDSAVRNALIESDPNCEAIMRPYLRGQDIKRWIPEWADLWMIVLKSSENHTWEWSNAGDEAEAILLSTYPSLYQHLKPHEDRLRQRQDQGRYWWELRSCDYYEVFESPGIIHTDITWRPEFALSSDPKYLVNTAYKWPISDLYVLATINSPLMWSYMWRHAIHGKDEALRMIYSFVITIPIATPSDDVRHEVEERVQRQLDLTQNLQQSLRDVFDWLRVEFDVDKPGNKLQDFTSLNEDDFISEVKKRGSQRLTPAALRVLREQFAEYSPAIRQIDAERTQIEHRLSDLVNQAYGLTPEEVDLMWRTAPPRMPIKPPNAI